METKFKNVLITGASSGIGQAMALYYAAADTERLLSADATANAWTKLSGNAKKFGAKVDAAIIDVNDRDKVKRWIVGSNKKQRFIWCWPMPESPPPPKWKKTSTIPSIPTFSGFCTPCCRQLKYSPNGGPKRRWRLPC